MSLNVNLRSPEIATAYQAVVRGDPLTEWAIFTYEKGTNDLKVQSTGAGGLEELEEEFSDGKIQYAFARVKDPNTQLPKFVQINWCGDGVPETKKGLFHTHASAVGSFLKGTHVVINARSEADVSPALILKRINDSSGSKYSFHGESPSISRRPEPIAAVGTTHTPVGRPDIEAMRKQGVGKAPAPAPVGTNYAPVGKVDIAALRKATPSESVPSAPRPGQSRAPADAWDAPAPRAAAPPSIPSSTRPSPVVAKPPIVSYASPPQEQPKPPAPDRIEPVGTAYTPVALPAPKKLVNPFAARQQGAASIPPPVSPAGAPKKLTWSERQALAKKQSEADEQSSKGASLRAGVGIGAALGVGAAALAVVASQAEDAPEPSLEPEEPAYEPPPPPPPPPPPAPPAPPVVDKEDDIELAEQTQTALHISQPEPDSGVRAVVTFAYQAAESNEMDLIEGEIIDQIEQTDPDWWHGHGPGGKSGLFPANYVEILEDTPADEVEEAVAVEEEAPAPPSPDVPAAPPAPPVPLAPPAPAASEATEDHGVVATAIYEYEAAEDNEISFKEGETITQIDTTVSDDWWSGTTADGATGLFPSTYVELHA